MLSKFSEGFYRLLLHITSFGITAIGLQQYGYQTLLSSEENLADGDRIELFFWAAVSGIFLSLIVEIIKKVGYEKFTDSIKAKNWIFAVFFGLSVSISTAGSFSFAAAPVFSLIGYASYQQNYDRDAREEYNKDIGWVKGSISSLTTVTQGLLDTQTSLMTSELGVVIGLDDDGNEIREGGDSCDNIRTEAGDGAIFDAQETRVNIAQNAVNIVSALKVSLSKHTPNTLLEMRDAAYEINALLAANSGSLKSLLTDYLQKADGSQTFPRTIKIDGKSTVTQVACINSTIVSGINAALTIINDLGTNQVITPEPLREKAVAVSSLPVELLALPFTGSLHYPVQAVAMTIIFTALLELMILYLGIFRRFQKPLGDYIQYFPNGMITELRRALYQFIVRDKDGYTLLYFPNQVMKRITDTVPQDMINTLRLIVEAYELNGILHPQDIVVRKTKGNHAVFSKELKERFGFYDEINNWTCYYVDMKKLDKELTDAFNWYGDIVKVHPTNSNFTHFLR